MSAGAFRQLLEEGDFKALRSAWMQVAPHLPQPSSDEQAEIVMHMARTSSAAVQFDKRAYSHRWLTERLLPSQLPDELKSKAERLYPVIAEGVAIMVGTDKEWLKPALVEVRGAMEDAVSHCYADGQTDPEFVKSRMFEARDKTLKQLFGAH